MGGEAQGSKLKAEVRGQGAEPGSENGEREEGLKAQS